MASKSYRGPLNLARIDGSRPINGYPRLIAERQTYPAVRQRNQLSLDADPVFLNFYQKLESGRRCTCWAKDASPHSECQNCFGTGFVGGYNKYGTYQTVVDAGLPEITAVGLIKESNQEGPEMWVLDDDRLSGYLEARLNFQGNWGPVDHLDLLHYIPDGGSVRWKIRAYGQQAYVDLTRENLDTLFLRPQLLELRVEVDRAGLHVDSPVVTNAHIRIKRTPTTDTTVRADRPRITRAFALAELGALDEWTTAQHWLDHTLSRITSHDWFYNVNEKIRWKVVDAQDLAPQQYLLSWDCTCRRVQEFEPIARYPV